MTKEKSCCARNSIWVILALLLAAGSAPAQSKTDPLKSGFENPPNSAKPRVWWHWMDGNVTKEGIKLDLEWMHRVGLGGLHIFDIAISKNDCCSLPTGQFVEQRLAYMTPGWKDAFKYATILADHMGMEVGISSAPGWGETGGPWVPAPQAMKKYVWSETRVEGGKPFTGRLAHPPSNAGPFQNVGSGTSASTESQAQRFYADSAVVAYKAPAGDVTTEDLQPKITSSGGAIDTALLSDGDVEKTTALPMAPEGGKAWIQYEFPQPQTIRGLTIVASGGGRSEHFMSPGGESGQALEASNDGRTYHVVASIPRGGSREHTITFTPATAKFFRVTFKTMAPPRGRSLDLEMETRGLSIPKPPTEYSIAELVLHAGARVNRFEEKAAFIVLPDLYRFATPPATAGEAIAKSDVADLTSKLRADGTLDWTPPAGNWVVLRFGYSLLGAHNNPAEPEATGLEVDKMNRGFVKNYISRFLDSYKETVGADYMGQRGIQYVINDSWEAGPQNWTDDMIAQFKMRRGYEMLPWMPVLAGKVVESAEASDRFLWDFRKTIADLIADEHYGQIVAALHERGMGHYSESHEAGRAFIGDGMEVKKFSEVPMGAMWTERLGVNHERYAYNADDRESASVAHIYGRNLAAAESMTAGAVDSWGWSPATLKPTADQELVNGINRIVIHESTHQPLVGKAPGLTLGPFGQWFNRNETWAEEAGPWVSYLARCSYLLQQGRFGADLVYFYGEDSNLTAIFENKAPDVPAGYGFDYINADGLIHALSVANGRITTQSAMSYRVLGLDPYSQHMSLPVLRAIHKLVEAGAVVAGPKPTDDPSLADDPAEFKKLNDELFGNGTGPHHVGKGAVYAGQGLADVLNGLHVPPDFDYTKPESDTRILFVHRKLADGDVYFVANRNDRDESVDASFRVTAKAPELWHPDTGKSEPASYKIANGRTTVPLHLEPWGTVFVVFRKSATTLSRSLPKAVERELATVDGSWQVAFQPGRGAPASVTLDKLMSWSDCTDAGVKYFSGAGAYTKTIQAAAGWFKPGAKLWIDLGRVYNLAEVTVNGKPLGIVWHTPYRVDATSALKPGANEVTIKVINAWVNRLIGDQQPGATTEYAFADVKPYKANSPLLPSGLLGPVRLYSIAIQ